jgi:O-antigen/teichoic acid export membrane protein
VIARDSGLVEEAPLSSGVRTDRIGTNIAALLSSQVATWSMTLVWTLVVPRLLGPAGIGLLVMAWSASSLLTIIGGVASRTLLVKEIAAHHERAPRLLGAALTVRAACVVPCVLLTLVYIRLGHFSTEQVLVLYLAAGISLLSLLLEPLQAAFQALERMEYLAYAEVVNKALITICGIVLVVLGFKALSLVAVMVIGAAVVLTLSALWSRRYFRIAWTLDWTVIHSLLTGSLAYWAFAFFFTFYLWIDSAMLALLTTTEVVGWYGVPTKLFGTLLFLPMIISTAWLPRLAAAFAESPERLRAIARTPVELILAIVLPLSAGAALTAGPLIRLLYGSDFDPAAPVFTLLALTIVPMAINMIVYQILVASGRQAIWTAALAGACIVNPALNFVLIRYTQAHLGNGAVGAAVSLLLTELLIATLAVVLVWPYLEWGAARRLLRAGIATLGMAVVVQLALRYGLVAGVLAGAISYALLALILRVVTAEELRGLRPVLEVGRRRLRWLSN